MKVIIVVGVSVMFLTCLIPYNVKGYDDYNTDIVPTGDSYIGWESQIPASPTTHWDKVDDGMTHDGDTTYAIAEEHGVIDRFILGDISTPDGTPDINVTVFAYAKRLSTGGATFECGLYIGSTYYQGADGSANSDWTEYTYMWDLNPDTTAEWTYSEINDLIGYISAIDAQPDVGCTAFVVNVNFDYPPDEPEPPENQAPVINSSPIETGDYDVLYEYDVDATDADIPPDTLLYELNSNATFLGIDPDTGLISGTPDETETKWYLVNITVSDQNTTVEEKFDWQEYQLTIYYYENNPPIISSSPIETGDYDVLYEYDVDATDADDDTLLYELNSNATFLGINPDTGLISGTPDETETKWYLVNITVSDQNTTVEEKFDWQEYQLTITYTPPLVNNAPVITSNAILTGYYDILYEYDVDATDDDPPDVLLYELYSNATFLSMDNVTGEITGTPDSYGWFWVIVEVYDQNVTGGNLSDSQEYDLTIWYNFVPEITSSAVLIGYFEVGYTYDVDATDNNPPDVLLYELYTNATFLSMNNITGEITGTPDSYGVFWVIVYVYDQNVTGGNLSDSQEYDLTVSVESVSEDLLTNAQIAIFVVIIGIICVILIIGVSEKK